MLRTIKHYWGAKSVYRIHSPYVFWWANHCLKKRTLIKIGDTINPPKGYMLSQRQRNIIAAHIKSTSAIKVVWVDLNSDFKTLEKQTGDHLSKTIIIIRNGYLDHFFDALSFKQKSPHSVVVIKNNRKEDQLWNRWIAQKHAALTLDVLSLGLAIYRAGIVRQHFKLC